jgi:hypothetical protein
VRTSGSGHGERVYGQRTRVTTSSSNPGMVAARAHFAPVAACLPGVMANFIVACALSDDNPLGIV